MNTTIVWHELTHVSHLQRLKNDKEFLWASDYWSRNIYQQAKNEIATDSPYGSKVDANWQVIALAEGWANYREAKIKRNQGSLEKDDIKRYIS